MTGRGAIGSARAAVWTVRALREARSALRRSGLDAVRVPPPPRVSPAAERGVHAVLRRQPNTCLERALVLQRWRAAVGDPRDVVIGVRGPSDGFQAHAWLDGEPDILAHRYDELLRVPSP